MFRIGLDRLISRLEKAADRRYTILEISKASGVKRNVISRILNDPNENVTVKQLDLLAQYFFYEFKRLGPLDDTGKATGEAISEPSDSSQRAMEDRLRMQILVGMLIDIFPEQHEHAEFLKRFRESDPLGEETSLPSVPELWRMYGFMESIREQPNNLPRRRANNAKSKKKSNK